MILSGNPPPVARRQAASDGNYFFAPDYLGHLSHSLARPSQSVHNKLYSNEIAV